VPSRAGRTRWLPDPHAAPSNPPFRSVPTRGRKWLAGIQPAPWQLRPTDIDRSKIEITKHTWRGFDYDFGSVTGLVYDGRDAMLGAFTGIGSVGCTRTGADVAGDGTRQPMRTGRSPYRQTRPCPLPKRAVTKSIAAGPRSGGEYAHPRQLWPATFEAESTQVPPPPCRSPLNLRAPDQPRLKHCKATVPARGDNACGRCVASGRRGRADCRRENREGLEACCAATYINRLGPRRRT